MSHAADQLHQCAQALVARLATLQSLAVAESLTGGMVSSTIVGVPGASNCFRAGVCTYATDTKHTLLGVDAQHLAQYGPVNATTAQQMAAGVARLAHSDWGLATTGVAGPGPENAIPAGTAFIAAHHRPSGRTWGEEHHFSGQRTQVREAVTLAALKLLLRASDEL